MKAIVLVVLMSFVVAAGVADSLAQTAGSTLLSVSVAELREVAKGWSATPNKSVSYAIVGVGGFLGVGEHDVAVPVSKFKQQGGKIVLKGATKDALKAAPKFEYAK